MVTKQASTTLAAEPRNKTDESDSREGERSVGSQARVMTGLTHVQIKKRPVFSVDGTAPAVVVSVLTKSAADSVLASVAVFVNFQSGSCVQLNLCLLSFVLPKRVIVNTHERNLTHIIHPQNCAFPLLPRCCGWLLAD